MSWTMRMKNNSCSLLCLLDHLLAVSEEAHEVLISLI